MASITIVDELTRVMDNMVLMMKEPAESLNSQHYDNNAGLDQALQHIAGKFSGSKHEE